MDYLLNEPGYEQNLIQNYRKYAGFNLIIGEIDKDNQCVKEVKYFKHDNHSKYRDDDSKHPDDSMGKM